MEAGGSISDSTPPRETARVIRRTLFISMRPASTPPCSPKAIMAAVWVPALLTSSSLTPLFCCQETPRFYAGLSLEGSRRFESRAGHRTRPRRHAKRVEQFSPWLGQGTIVAREFAAAKAVATEREARRFILWRPPPRPRQLTLPHSPGRARGWIVRRAFARRCPASAVFLSPRCGAPAVLRSGSSALKRTRRHAGGHETE